MRGENLPWGERTCAYAAKGGHLEMLKWARENDCPWDAKTCMYAAEGGHLEMLKWARANGCPWYASTCWYAAKGGHLEVLKWLRANGCPWNEHTRRLAASKGYVETLAATRETGSHLDRVNHDDRRPRRDETRRDERYERCDEHASDARAVSVVPTAAPTTAPAKCWLRRRDFRSRRKSCSAHRALGHHRHCTIVGPSITWSGSSWGGSGIRESFVKRRL